MAGAASDVVMVRVTRRHHTHKGTTYRTGDEFPGTERLLKAFGDRLERVAESRKAEPQPAPEDDLEALRTEAEAAGVKVDKRWGEDRLREEIANADASDSE